jgi:D-hydroxyproline dehydrogenase subunit beta
MDVVVIGAGVVGASIAARLARRGANVTLVDKSPPGTGTSATSYAWVNANGKEPQSYYELNHAGVRAHHGLAAEGAPWLRASGHVEFAVDEAHQADLAERMRRLSDRGYQVEEIDPNRARALLSDVDVPGDAPLIAYFAEEAHCFPLRYVAAMLTRARAAGAAIVTGTEIVELRGRGSGAELRSADGTVWRADIVVSAAGKWTGAIAGLAGLTVPVLRFAEPGDVTVGFLMETDPLPVELDRVVTTPWLNIRPAGGDHLLLQALDLDATADPRAVPSATSPVAVEMLSRLKAVLRNTEAAAIRRVMVGERVMPADGHTVVGTLPELPWLYFVATHSGVTLAPFLGERVAAEIYGADEPLFADYRPQRFRSAAPIRPPQRPRKPGQQ